MNSPRFDEYAVRADLADAVTTQDEDLGQTAGHHRRPTEPRFAHARGWVETVAVSAAMLTGLLLATTHGLPGSANHGAPVGEVATATPHPSRDVGTCVVARGRPAIDEHAGADRDSRHSGTLRTDLPSCATEEQRAVQSAYLAQLLAQHSANARPAATRVRLG